MFKPRELSALLVASLLTACTSMPTGPSMMALPGSGKSFDIFRNDDNQCRQFAHERVSETSTDNTPEYADQQRYDTSYVQCMYARGHRVPVYGQFTNIPTKSDNGNPNKSIPPPPSGKPPPPPE
ncbi:MAG: hypothetical protein V3S58_03840 [Nitrosomonadaceae bacterium]